MGSPSIQTLKRLWALSGNECYRDGCREQLAYPDRAAVMGEVAHISAASPGGPRFSPEMSDAARDDFPNLVILCPTCHRKIDDVELDLWPAERLREMKMRHEDRRDKVELEGEELDLVVEVVRIRQLRSSAGSDRSAGGRDSGGGPLDQRPARPRRAPEVVRSPVAGPAGNDRRWPRSWLAVATAMEALPQPFTALDVVDASGASAGTVNRMLLKLLEDGVVRRFKGRGDRRFHYRFEVGARERFDAERTLVAPVELPHPGSLRSGADRVVA